MTFEECSTASCCACREFPVCCCPALSGWQRVRPALKARDEAWPAALSTPPTLPARCTPPSAATSASSFQPAALLADGSCSKLLLDPQAVATAAPVAAAVGREILDAACRPCRTLAGCQCCLPANERLDLPGDQPIRGWESGLLRGSCWVRQLCRRRWQPQVERASMYSSPIPVPDLSTRVSRALAQSLSDREQWIPAKDIHLPWQLDEVSGV